MRWLLGGGVILCLAQAVVWADCNCDCQKQQLIDQLNAKKQEQAQLLALGKTFQTKARLDVGQLEQDRKQVYDLLLNKAEVKEREALTKCQ